MTRFVIVSVLFLLIASSGYSQNGYPRRIVLEGDSLVAITLNQMKSLNLAKVSFDECQEKNLALIKLDSLNQAIGTANSALIDNKNKQLLLAEKRLNGAEATISELISQNQRKTAWQKLQGGVLLGVIAGLLTYIIIK